MVHNWQKIESRCHKILLGMQNGFVYLFPNIQNQFLWFCQTRQFRKKVIFLKRPHSSVKIEELHRKPKIYTSCLVRYLKIYTKNPEWIIWLIWAIVGQYTDKMTQKCVKNESFCPCSDTLWLKWVKWFTRGFQWSFLSLKNNGSILKQIVWGTQKWY